VPNRLLTLIAALALGLAALVAGCGEDEESSSGARPAQQERTLRVAIVTDIGGLNDRSFNQLAYQGLQRAQRELGVQGRALTSRSNADYVPNLSSLAQQRYDLVVGVGFLMAEAINTVAQRFPNVNFAIIDFSHSALEDKPANVRGLLFREQEAGYLAGYAAGLYTEAEGGEQVISAVGGQRIPPVERYIAGYEAGADAANNGIRVLSGYSQDFVDQARCRELALNQIQEGSQVVFQVAGQCGLGALDAARAENVQGIGVDADQGYLGDHVLTSALKKVDVAVFETVQQVQGNRFKGGADTVFDVKSGGVGLGRLNAAAQPFADRLRQVQEQIGSGEITDIPEEPQ
jgi:basic membrane protein A and related proteins